MRIFSKINGLILTIVFFILLYMIYNLNIIPIKYFLAIGIVLSLFVFLFDFKLIRKKTGIISRIFYNILSIIFIALSVVLMTYINATHDFVDSVVTKNLETANYNVIVNSNGSYNHIQDINQKEIGYLSIDENYSLVKYQIRKDIKYREKEFTDIDSFVETITTGHIDAVVLEDSFYNLLKEANSEFATNTRVIKQYKVIAKKQKVDKEIIKTSKEPFIMYISGIDTYGQISSVSRSDVNILAVVNPKNEKILLVSIPRDYYVPLNGNGGKDKLTHAGIYGIDTSINTINSLLDTNINYFVRLNFSTLTKTIDLIDGIDVYSDKTFVPYTNRKITIYEGNNHMNGAMALAFARERYAYTTGDRHRGENQQAIITAIINKMTDPKYVTKYKSILASLEGTFETSMTYEEITDLFKMQISKQTSWNVESISLDGTGSHASTYSMGSRQLYVMIPNEVTVNNAKIKIKEYVNN